MNKVGQRGKTRPKGPRQLLTRHRRHRGPPYRAQTALIRGESPFCGGFVDRYALMSLKNLSLSARMASRFSSGIESRFL
jgi:hypothetical protein